MLMIWLMVDWIKSDEPSITHKENVNSELLTASADTLESVVQAVDLDNQPQSATLENQSNKSSISVGVNNDHSDLLRRFTQADQYAQQGKDQEAIKVYRSLINDYPDLLEPYLNLATIYVEQQNLDQARLTLSAGLNAREDSSALYKALQQVHKALAAQSYQRALNKTQAQTSTLALRKATELSVPINSTVDKEQYEQRIAALKSRHQGEIDVYQGKISAFETQVETLQNELNSAALVASNVEAAQQAATQQLELLKEAEQQALLAKQQVQLAKQQAEREKAQALQKQKESIAVGLVNAWAKAWSAQDVKSYVSFYTDNYVPAGKNLTHKQWLAQRQVRLTNKSFISVDVSRHSIQDLGQRFSVTFVQHYRSDRIDDTIRKRLTFIKNGDDWSKAKIINESVL